MANPESILEKPLGNFDSYSGLLAAIQPFVSDRVLAAMKQADRALFMDGRQHRHFYDDEARFIPGFRGEASISQPSTVALMTELLDAQETDNVLEIGTGTGWQAAILSNLARRIVSVEITKPLARKSKRHIDNLALGIPPNLTVIAADGSIPLAKPESFDKMIITAALPPIADHRIFSMLKNGGRCVAPVGGLEGYPEIGELFVLEKVDGKMTEVSRFPGFSFVPMLGKEGWNFFIRSLIAGQRKYGFDQDVAPKPDGATDTVTPSEE